MNDWMYDKIAAQVSRERREAADRQRLANLASRNGSQPVRFYQHWIEQSGKMLVTWGLRLQCYASVRRDPLADAGWVPESLGQD